MNNKDYIQLLRDKGTIGGETIADSETQEMIETFNDMLDNQLTPTVHEVKLVRRENIGIGDIHEMIRVNVTDTSKNDQKAQDEKYFDFKLTDKIKVGDEILWDGIWYLMYHQEVNAVSSHNTFTAKKCNFLYSLEYKGVMYEFPSLLTNLTLYSDGMADKVQMSNADGKRKIYLPDNAYSKIIKSGTRIMITQNTVFEITHIDDFSRLGVKDCIMQQVFTLSLDDKEHNSAYNKNFMDDSEHKDDYILGSDEIYLGSEEIYTANHMFSFWEVISEDDCVYMDMTYKNDKLTQCKLVSINNSNHIGKKATLKLYLYGDVIATKEITVKGVF